MKHLMICREYPPAPSGGIGTYALSMSRMLAESGEYVHVIGQLWEGAQDILEEQCNGRLIIHRIPFDSWKSILKGQMHPAIGKGMLRDLYKSGLPAQCFSWQASLMAEKLVAEEGIDLLEAQDYEAPLYYFQLRRTLGMGPRRLPPCFIHLHSPSEFIAHHNGWKPGIPKVMIAKRLEDFSITAADALLCPSRFLARQVETLHGMPKGSVFVIPYPLGQIEHLERDQNVWEQGTICYTGRLEPRKGVLEWIDAARTVLCEHPGVRFEFVGTNALGPNRIIGEDALNHLIPTHLKPCFLFRGEQKRSSLSSYLRKARIAVVPSRWENFPYACIEAMGSGLPVIATCEGGMVEMLRDGQTGWLALKPTKSALLNALRRAVETPWAIISEMGHEASQSIRKICDDRTILTAQLEFRKRLVEREANRSLHLPKSLTLSRDDRTSVRKKTAEQKKPRGGIGIVVAACGGRTSLGGCIDGVERQWRKPTAVAIVYDRWTSFWAGSSLRRARKLGWQLIRRGDFGCAGSRAWTQAILSHGSESTAVVFLGSMNKLRPEFIATSEAILERCPEIGVVSCWAMRSGRIWIRPCPSFPYQWLCNDAVPFSAIRVEALKEIFRLGHDDESSEGDWKLVNSVMAAGWMAVTVPEVLADGNPSIRKPPYDRPRSAKASFEILSSKHSDLLLQKPDQIQSLLESESLTRWEILIARHAEFENAVYALHHPIKTIRWLLRQTWSRRKRFDGFA